VEARGTVLTGWEGELRIGGVELPSPKSTTLEDAAKRFREYPRPAKVESVATEQEPHAGMAGAFFVGGFSIRRLPHTHPQYIKRSLSPSSRWATSGHTNAAEDRAVPGNMMARHEVDGQVGIAPFQS
jgi:hypothetical protein